MKKSKVGDKLLPVLSGLLLLSLVLAAVSLYLGKRNADAEAASVQMLLQQKALAAQMSGAAQQAARGSGQGLQNLGSALNQSRSLRTPQFPTGMAQSGAQLQQAWSATVNSAAVITGSREAIAVVGRAAQSVRESAPILLAELGDLANTPGNSSLATQIPKVELAIQQMQQDFLALAAGLGDSEQLIQRIVNADNFLGQFVRGLSSGDGAPGVAAITGSAAQIKLAPIQSANTMINTAVRDTVVTAENLKALRQQADSIDNSATQVATLSDQARSAIAAAGGKVFSFISLGLIGFSLLVFLGLNGLLRKAGKAQRLAAHEAEQNTRNQDAILRLLDELGSLADGDLTVQATVSEDITGAIADSINYAIEALRDLVTTIDEAASSVDEAARQTRASASHLAQASDNQSRQVQAATESIAAMAESIEEVSHNAERSADVARHSVEIAHKGGEAVRRTIDGMNTIRETIQETSKRIKRLGESSQEIGNIVELINDIAEQTNILALNASIQASMAGEAGRGFAVVADEVQRLAERSTNATKQIEVLVNTIQSDTNEAVVSMERSTTDVVSGALLAENAGGALDEIEKVSNQIASLVQNISNSARTQATAAADITRNMGVLQEISSQTAEGSSATSTAIGKLAEMSTELRRSVAGFTLPEKDGGAAHGIANPAAASARLPAAATSS